MVGASQKLWAKDLTAKQKQTDQHIMYKTYQNKKHKNQL